MTVLGMDMISVDGAHEDTGSMGTAAWCTKDPPAAMGHMMFNGSGATELMRITQRAVLTVASYDSVAHPVRPGMGQWLMLTVVSTFRMKILNLLAMRVVATGLMRGGFWGGDRRRPVAARTRC